MEILSCFKTTSLLKLNEINVVWSSLAPYDLAFSSHFVVSLTYFFFFIVIYLYIYICSYRSPSIFLPFSALRIFTLFAVEFRKDQLHVYDRRHITLKAKTMHDTCYATTPKATHWRYAGYIYALSKTSHRPFNIVIGRILCNLNT